MRGDRDRESEWIALLYTNEPKRIPINGENIKISSIIHPPALNIKIMTIEKKKAEAKEKIVEP